MSESYMIQVAIGFVCTAVEVGHMSFQEYSNIKCFSGIKKCSQW